LISRRSVLAAGLIGSAVLGSRPLFGAEQLSTERPSSRRIALKNLHTGEALDLEYFRDDTYLPDAMAAIETVLRDFRNGDRHAIDPKLLDYLVEVAASIGRPAEFSVVSGYRSPETNERLHERSSGVSQHSLHMQGRAIDVRIVGLDCKDLAGGAESLMLGGVGYYRGSDFVHLDTGAFRTWKG
jgi:uncharacterized protein YcbK (DUF882 family)